VALVQSSERTGALGDALTRYISYRQRLDLVRQKLVGASVYPLLLLLVGGGVVLFLLGYVVPRFSQVFEGMGTELPWLSRVLMQIGLFLHAQQLPWRWARWAPPLLVCLRRHPAVRRWASASCAAAGPAPAPGDVRTGAFLPLAGDSAARWHSHPHRHGHGRGLLGSAAAEGLDKPASGWAKGCRCPMHWKPGTW
jgi:general secretion pathway protein F